MPAPSRPLVALTSTSIKSRDANRLDLKGNATVMQPCPFAAAEAVNDARRRSGASLLTAHDLAHLALRPMVVTWGPEKIDASDRRLS